MEEEEPKAHTPNKDINFARCTDDYKLTCSAKDVASNQPDEDIIKGYLNIGLKIYLIIILLIPIFERMEKLRLFILQNI